MNDPFQKFLRSILLDISAPIQKNSVYFITLKDFVFQDHLEIF